MTTFTSAREAKQFLIDLIVQEAQQDNVPLSETERKMLYFSQSASTLPDMDQVSADFDDHYDQDEYERRIGSLVWNLRERLKKENPGELRTWDSAVSWVRREDHYLLVLIDAGSSTPKSGASGSPWWSYVLGAGIGLLIILFATRSC